MRSQVSEGGFPLGVAMAPFAPADASPGIPELNPTPPYTFVFVDVCYTRADLWLVKPPAGLVLPVWGVVCPIGLSALSALDFGAAARHPVTPVIPKIRFVRSLMQCCDGRQPTRGRAVFLWAGGGPSGRGCGAPVIVGLSLLMLHSQSHNAVCSNWQRTLLEMPIDFQVGG